MKVRVDRKAFADALVAVAPAISARPDIPILSAVELRASGGELSIRATNHSLTIWRNLDAEVGDEGEAYISGHRLRDLVTRFSGADVTLSFDSNGSLVIESGSARYRLALMTASEFPAATELPEGAGSVKAEALADAIRRLAHASKGDEYAATAGMVVEANGKTLSLMSTDRYRVAITEIPYAGEPFAVRPLYPHLLAAAKSATGPVTIHAGLNNLAISSDHSAVMFQLVNNDGPENVYPPRERLLGVREGIRFSIDTEDLDDALERVGVLRERDVAAVIDITPDGLRISVGDNEGDGVESIAIATDGEGQFGVNPIYLRECLACISESRVEITAPPTPSGGRIWLTGLDGDRPSPDIHIVMAQRLNRRSN